MTEPIVTATAGYAMLTQDQLLTEVQRLEGLVATVTAERDMLANQICDQQEAVGILTAERDAARRLAEQYRKDFTPGAPLPWHQPLMFVHDRPSAYDMPVGSVVRSGGHDYMRWLAGWTCDTGRAGIESGWIEGLFTDGLVTEWRLP